MYVIADTVGGIAATPVGSGLGSTTVSGNIHYFRAFTELEKLYVNATVTKSGNRLIFVDTMILSEDGTVYAKADFIYAKLALPDNVKKL